MSSDIALSYDPSTHQCDLVFDGTDFVLDATPATPMLVSLGVKRRAAPDDTVLSLPSPFAAPSSLTARGGTPLDALDPNGLRMGSRIWLLANAKQSEDTRRRGQDYAAEGLDGLEDELSVSIALAVTWRAANRLKIAAQAGATTVAVLQSVSG